MMRSNVVLPQPDGPNKATSSPLGTSSVTSLSALKSPKFFLTLRISILNIDEKSELSFSYVHAFSNTVNGTSAIPAGFGGGNVSLKMYQDSLGVAYAYKF